MKGFKFSSKVREVLTQEELRQIIGKDGEYKCICDFFRKYGFIDKEAYTKTSNAVISDETCKNICKDACAADVFCFDYYYRVEAPAEDQGSGSGSDSESDKGSDDECSGSCGSGSGYCDKCSCGCNHLCYGSCSCGDACTCGSTDDINRP